MTLHALFQTVDVLSPRPPASRDYNGAVGRFDVRAALTPTTGTTFAPMSLKIEVTGQGNLDRVSTAGLPSSANGRLIRQARRSPTGSKVFEQAVVPPIEWRLEIPLFVQLLRSRRHQY